MKKFEHLNTIVNVEYYFKMHGVTYLKELIHSPVNDNFTGHWYSVGKNEKLKVVTNIELEKELNEFYNDWIKENYDF